MIGGDGTLFYFSGSLSEFPRNVCHDLSVNLKPYNKASLCQSEDTDCEPTNCSSYS